MPGKVIRVPDYFRQFVSGIAHCDFEVFHEFITLNPVLYSHLPVTVYVNVTDGEEKRLSELRIVAWYSELILPPSIVQWKNLSRIVIDLVDGLYTLPLSIGRLSNLRELILRTPQLTKLPKTIGGLIRLEKLDIQMHTIDALPASIGRLSCLKTFKISDARKLKQLPEDVGCLTSLNELTLTASGIAVLPESVCQLQNLSVLNLRGSSWLSKLPDNIGNLTSLTRLNLCCSGIQSLPTSIGQLKNLQDLNISHTSNLSNLPDMVVDLTSLIKLNLGYTKITSLPRRIGQVKNLNDLNLVSSCIEDLPQSIGDLENLRSLNLSYTGIAPVCDSIHKLSRLMSFGILMNEGSKVPVHLVWKLLQRNRFLGHVVCIRPLPYTEWHNIEVALARNRVRFRIWPWITASHPNIGTIQKLWPNILNNPQSAFSDYPKLSEWDVRRTLPLFMSKPDKIYEILRDCEPFIRLLVHRNGKEEPSCKRRKITH